MFDYKYLSPKHLEGFDNYKYQAIDTSPLSVYVMHPFWNKVVEIVPRWVAPNILTFAGFLLIVLDFLLLSYYDYRYFAANFSPNATIAESTGYQQEVIPKCLWFYLALFLFLAYTLDGIDGKQARRTKTSGPLGELFDHGLDSYTVFFIPACLYSIFGRSLDFSVHPSRMYYVVWSILLNFYMSHWEKYNTGVLYLPWGYDFGMWSSIMFFIWTGVKGTSYYKRYLYGPYTLANAFECLVYTTGLTNIPVAAYNTYRSYKDGTGKMRSCSEAIRPIWSLLTVFLVLAFWVQKSDTLSDYDPRMLFVLTGTLFSNVACRLIVSQMSGQRCEAINALLAPLAFAAFVSVARPKYELPLLYGVTLMTVLAHVHYGTCVVRQMCDHFNIECFYIKKKD